MVKTNKQTDRNPLFQALLFPQSGWEFFGEEDFRMRSLALKNRLGKLELPIELITDLAREVLNEGW